MKANGKFIYTEDYKSPKTGMTYLTLADGETGGTWSMATDQIPPGIEKFKPFDAEIELTARRSPNGGSYLTLISFKLAK